jgi:deoxycytidine triphosphate deaminase
MFTYPINAITNAEVLSDSSYQINGIDVTCDRLFRLTTNSNTVIPLDGKTTHTNQMEILTHHQHTLNDNTRASALTKDDHWHLVGNVVAYPFMSDIEVEIPDGFCGWLITRSSLNRNGVIVQSGLYDAGFKGNIAGTLYKFNNNTVSLERGCRVAQFILAKAESRGLYNGQYQKQT